MGQELTRERLRELKAVLGEEFLRYFSLNTVPTDNDDIDDPGIRNSLEIACSTIEQLGEIGMSDQQIYAWFRSNQGEFDQKTPAWFILIGRHRPDQTGATVNAAIHRLSKSRVRV